MKVIIGVDTTAGQGETDAVKFWQFEWLFGDLGLTVISNGRRLPRFDLRSRHSGRVTAGGKGGWRRTT